jgi:hypothetical protein
VRYGTSHLLQFLKRPSEALLPADEVTTIFGQYAELLGVHEVFLSRLGERQKLWNPSLQLGDIFLGLGPFLKLYTRYVKVVAPNGRNIKPPLS